MTTHIKRLLILLILLSAAVRAPLARAEGGLVFRPYWTFRTDAPVTHVETGDINGDGALEVVIVTADNWVHVLDNSGLLAWRYQAGFPVNALAVADIENDGGAEEILVAGEGVYLLLRDTERPACMFTPQSAGNASGLNVWRFDVQFYAATAVDLDGDGKRELLYGTDTRMGAINAACEDLPDRIYPTERPVTGIWIGDVEEDGQPKLLPSPAGGATVYLFGTNRDLLWQALIAGEVSLVQGGDVDGDGQAEVVILSAAWDLFLLESDGSQVWQKDDLTGGQATGDPLSGQLAVYDLNGDGTMEIVVITPAPDVIVNVFAGDGNLVWQHRLGSVTGGAKLTAGDANDDGQAEVVVTTIGQTQVYLLAADGQRLAEYHRLTLSTMAGQTAGGTTGALAYVDLNDDDWGEVIVGTEIGLQVFGASNQVVRRKLWQSPLLVGADTVSALYLGDLDGDGQGEVVVGSQLGKIAILAEDGNILQSISLISINRDDPGRRVLRASIGTFPILALTAGDVDGDGQYEVTVGSLGRSEGGALTHGGGLIHLLDGNRRKWVAPVPGRSISGLAMPDLDGDGRAEIVVGVKLSAGGAVLVLDGQGELIWQQEYAEAVTAVSVDGTQILAGTQNGRVYRLTATGSPVEEYDLGAKVISFGEGLVATAIGQVYQLGDSEPTLAYEVGDVRAKFQVGPVSVMSQKGGQVSLASGAGIVWQGAVDGKIFSLAMGDLNGDGTDEIAVGTDGGRVHLFGLALDQLPVLTKPDLAETRDGYIYSVNVNDPDGEAVTVNLEIWDPSEGIWVTPSVRTLPDGQGQVSWEVSNEIFDIWDSGQESRFRFRYDDGQTQRLTSEIPGPFNIPTIPWYIYYGQRAGLGALILMIPALGFVLYRRQRVHRRSPAGRAETLLKQLRTSPDETLLRLHGLARDNSALLTYLPAQAREAGDTAMADLSEGLNLILIRPEVTGQDLRTVKEAIERLDGPPDEQKRTMIDLYDLLARALEANTVTRIIALRSMTTEVVTTVTTVAHPRVVTTSVVQPLTAIGDTLTELGRVVQSLQNYQRVEAVEDKTAYLGQALEALGRLEREFRTRLPQPERNILTRIAANWLVVANNTLQDLQGRAQLEVALKTRQLLNLDQAILSLELTNTGRSPASNITVNLVPDQTFAVGNGTAQLDILPAGRSAVVELAISAAASVEQFRAEFNITFDDRERSGKSLAYADMVHLLRPAAEFEPLPNPYAPGTPLRPGSAIFFGRDDLFQFIAENIAGLARQNILVLIGQRRMGKTSFLQQLPARLGEEYLPVYIDGQSLGIDPGMANFFYDLALAIVDALADQGIEVEEPEPEEFEERPSGAFERAFLPTIFEAIGQQRQLLLLFDEFEELEMRVKSGKLEPTIFPFFRHLMQHSRKLGFIFVGTHRLEALSSDYWSIFFNIALYKHVAFLDETAARALIVEPVAEYGLLYDDLALDKMLRVTAGHPYFLQLTCHALVNRANRTGRGYLTIQDVNDVLAEMVELGEAHFAFLWEQSGPRERLILASLTRLLGQEPTLTAAQVAELLAERGVPLAVRDVTEALRQLVERDIIREVTGQPPRYEYKVELVRLWVERYKALGRVVEESDD